MLKDYVYKLTDPNALDHTVVGGKAASLAKMIQEGFKVPGGYVVPGTVLNEVLKLNSLDTLVDQYLAANKQKDNDKLNEISTRLKRSLETAQLPKGLEHALDEIIQSTHEGDRFAIRSSANVEDGSERSYAGLFETELNVKPNDLEKNVRKCWSSLFDVRTLIYGELDESSWSMGVVLQKMVIPSISGVGFSFNPVTHEHNILINACFGLGEALVSGEITPASYEYNRLSGETLKFTPSSQTKKLVANDTNTSGITWVNHDEQDNNPITDEEVQTVCDSILQLEKAAGGPVDIEWVLDENRTFYLTQSRPVTTAKSTTDDIWRTLVTDYLRTVAHSPYRALKLNTLPVLWTQPLNLSCGYSYQVVSPVLTIYKDGVLNFYVNDDDLYGFGSELAARSVCDSDLNVHISQHYGVVKGMIENLHDRYWDIHQSSDDNLSFQLESLDACSQLFGQLLTATTISYIEDKALLHAAVVNKDIGIDLIREAATCDTTFTSEIWTAIDIVDADEKTCNLNKYRYVLSSYIEIATKEQVKAHFETIDQNNTRLEIDQAKLNTQSEKDRLDRIIEKCNVGEQNLIEFVQLAKEMREERKTYLIKLLVILYEAQERIKASWILDGLYFVHELLQGYEYCRSLDVSSRENGYVALLPSSIPSSWQVTTEGVDQAIDLMEKSLLPKDANHIEGDSAFAGSVTGTAFVVNTIEDFETLQPSDDLILVINATRPEVVKYLNNFIGIVTNEGGITSHAATISRELKIPCVIGTQHATRLINSGDQIEVDSNHARGYIKHL